MKVEAKKLDHLVNKAKGLLSGFEREFFERIWATDLDIYRKRIEIIGFNNLNRVLDAGFGNGQWTICLSESNKEVFGIEYSEAKLNAVKHIFTGLGINNTHLLQGNIEALKFKEDFFDAIFCYSVIYFTDIRKTLKEFYRVLKKDGKLYFVTNGLGWYLMCLIEEHNKSSNHDPRQLSAEAIENTFEYFFNDNFKSGKQLFLPKNLLRKLLSEVGFSNILIEPEGSINFLGDKSLSFYNRTKYLGQDFIYDVYCEK